MACSRYFSGRDLGCKRLISDPHPWVQGTQALSPFTLLLHLSHSQPPLIYSLDSRIFLAVYPGLLQMRFFKLSHSTVGDPFPLLFAFSLLATPSQNRGGSSLCKGSKEGFG